MMLRRRDPLILAATGLLAIAVPVAASRHLAARVAGLGPALSELTGEPSSIAGVEAGLTGEVRVTGVEIGDLLRIDAVEAAVSLDSLLSGDLGADEIRLERPRLRARVDGAGESNLARVIRRIAARRRGGGGASAGRQRLQRIVVTEGALVVEVVGVGRFEARGVELHPQRGGVRVVTGAVRGRLDVGPFAVAAAFTRGGGDLTLPEARLQRFLAVGGELTVTAGGDPLAVRGVALGWSLSGDHLLTLRGDVDDHGVPRTLSVTSRPGAGFAAVDLRGADIPLAFLEALAPAGLDLRDAHASGALTATRTATGWSAQADADLRGVQVGHRAITDTPFVADGALALTVERDGAMISIPALRLRRGALQVDGSGRVRRGGPSGLAAGELSLTLAEAPCLDLIAAVPAAVRGPLGAFAMEGRIAGTAHLAFDLDAAPGEGVELAVDVGNGCRVLGDPPEADVATLAAVADHSFPDGTRVPVGPGVGDWIALTALPGHVDGAFVAAEDAAFHQHHGFDTQQIARSLEVNLREGRFARGGSTISQQLVKNAFLSHRRTLDRKLQEAVLTWRLEAVLTKRQILERYLNVVELGPGIYGVAAAARHWFGKPARDLTVKESAFLAAMTPEPRSMSRRVVGAGALDAQSAERVDTVLRHMRRAGVISEDERARARRATLAFRADALVETPRLTMR